MKSGGLSEISDFMYWLWANPKGDWPESDFHTFQLFSPGFSKAFVDNPLARL